MTEIAPDRQVIDVLGVPVARLTLASLLGRVQDFVRGHEFHMVMYANVHTVNLAQGDPALRRAFQEADLVYCDGAGVKLGARILGQHLPERMTGADWIHDLCALSARQGYALYLYGGRPGVADKAADVLRVRHGGLRIVGTSHGFLDGKERDRLSGMINSARPDILLVGLGTPRQELWLTGVKPQLCVPVCWTVGALFDFVASEVPRAPRWMCDHGLEWLFRLCAEPTRLWRRYLVGNALFLGRILWARMIGSSGTHL